MKECHNISVGRSEVNDLCYTTVHFHVKQLSQGPSVKVKKPGENENDKTETRTNLKVKGQNQHTREQHRGVQSGELCWCGCTAPPSNGSLLPPSALEIIMD